MYKDQSSIHEHDRIILSLGLTESIAQIKQKM